MPINPGPPEPGPERTADDEPHVNPGPPELQPTDSGDRRNRNPGPPERRSHDSAQGPDAGPPHANPGPA